MPVEEVHLNKDNAFWAALNTSVYIYARQEALLKLVVTHLISKGENEAELLKELNEDTKAARTEILGVLYADFGVTPPLGDFFPGKDKE